MPTCLQDCPSELVEEIITQLSLDDIRKLRLTCHSLARKCSQQHFGSFFRSKELRLNKHGLETFVDLTRAGGLGCLVEDLTLIGVVSINGEPDAPLGVGAEEAGLLAKSFQQLATNKKGGTLPSLWLSIMSMRDGVIVSSDTTGACSALEQHFAVDLADRMLLAIMDALASSRLKLLKFNAFYTCDRKRAGPPCSELANIDFGSERLKHSFSGLTQLKFNIADPTTEGMVKQAAEAADPPHNRALVLGSERYAGLSRLLSTCRQLDVLRIDYHRLDWKAQAYGEDGPTYHEYLFKHLVNPPTLPPMTLRNLTLFGLDIAATDLLGFLRHTSAYSLRISRVNISTGPIRPLLEYVGHLDTALRVVCFLYPRYRSGMLTFGHRYSGCFIGNKKSGKRITEYRTGSDSVTVLGL